MSVLAVTDQEFQDSLKQNDKVIVKYYADWCGSCRLFAPKFRRLAGEEQYSGITFLDVNAEKSPEARKAAGVSNLPFFAVFEKGELKDGLATNKEDVVRELLGRLS